MTSQPRSPLIPSDFPRESPPGAVTGAHPKMLMREVDGHIVAGLTDNEVQVRYDVCADLVVQMEAYCERKQQENPDQDRLVLLQRIRLEVGQKGWCVSEAELDWIMGKLGLPLDAAPRTLVPAQVVPSWLEPFLTQTVCEPPSVKKGQLRRMIEEGRSRAVDRK